MIDPVQIQSIVAEFQAHYNLKQWEIFYMLETTISETMTSRFDCYSEATVDRQTYELDICLYKDRLFNDAITVSPRNIRGFKGITRKLTKKIEKLAAQHQQKKNRLKINSLCKGAITSTGNDGMFLVEIVLHKQVIARWPKRFQTKNDRENGFYYGENKIFRIQTIELVEEDGQTKCYALLDRTSKKFIELLVRNLARMSEDEPCTCVKRYVGKYSEIWVSRLLDKDVIKRVREETGEFLRVIVGRNKVEIDENRRKLIKKSRAKSHKLKNIDPQRSLEDVFNRA